MRILLVEDDKFLSNALRVKLEKAGFTVAISANGEEGLASLKEEKPALIVADLVMPVMDGFDFLVAVKEHDEYKDIPIIVASNLSQKEDFDKARELGAKDFFIKSDMSMTQLIEKINALVKKDD